MYPISRYMKIFKGYTENHHYLEALIVERYVTEEAVEFCLNYLLEEHYIWIPKSHHDGRYKGRGTQDLNVKSMTQDEVLQVHLYIFNNIDEV